MRAILDGSPASSSGRDQRNINVARIMIADTVARSGRRSGPSVVLYALENVQNDTAFPEFHGHYADDAAVVLDLRIP